MQGKHGLLERDAQTIMALSKEMRKITGEHHFLCLRKHCFRKDSDPNTDAAFEYLQSHYPTVPFILHVYRPFISLITILIKCRYREIIFRVSVKVTGFILIVKYRHCVR